MMEEKNKKIILKIILSASDEMESYLLRNSIFSDKEFRKIFFDKLYLNFVRERYEYKFHESTNLYRKYRDFANDPNRDSFLEFKKYAFQAFSHIQSSLFYILLNYFHDFFKMHVDKNFYFDVDVLREKSAIISLYQSEKCEKDFDKIFMNIQETAPRDAGPDYILDRFENFLIRISTVFFSKCIDFIFDDLYSPEEICKIDKVSSIKSALQFLKENLEFYEYAKDDPEEEPEGENEEENKWMEELGL